MRCILLTVLLALAGCGSGEQADAAGLCDAVDELVAVAADLGTEPDEITDDYRRLAERYDRIADELEGPAASDQARRLGEVISTAADDLDAVDLREEVGALTEVSDAAAEMSDTINANLPVGLGPAGMEEVERRCAPDFGGLTPSR